MPVLTNFKARLAGKIEEKAAKEKAEAEAAGRAVCALCIAARPATPISAWSRTHTPVAAPAHTHTRTRRRVADLGGSRAGVDPGGGGGGGGGF